MSVLASTKSTATIPGDVRAFAALQGVDTYLSGILAMTGRVFPGAVLRVLLVDDPEVPDYRRIAVEVETNSDDVDHLLRSQNEWTAELLKACPAIHAVHFLLRML